MARLRVFVSSTFYDLKYIRANLEGFIKTFGYEPVLFESGDIGFHPDLPLDESCYKEIENSHMQILIIGGKYGSPATNQLDKKIDEVEQVVDSVTKREFLAALELNIPVYFFVDNGVLSEYSTYKLNKGSKAIKYAHVDNENVFKLIELIYKRGAGNLVNGFSKFEDISNSLKNQWSHLFTELLKSRKTSSELNDLNNSLSKLNSVTESLQTYSEAILKSVDAQNFPSVKTGVDNKIIQDKLDAIFRNPFVREVSRAYDLNAKKVLLEIDKSTTFKSFIRNVSNKENVLLNNAWSEKAISEYFNIRKELDFIEREKLMQYLADK
jgi:hypothetical protein